MIRKGNNPSALAPARRGLLLAEPRGSGSNDGGVGGTSAPVTLALSGIKHGDAKRWADPSVGVQ
jgi:hypothetical protein